MIDTCRAACCPPCSDGFTRGADGQRATTEVTGATPAEVARWLGVSRQAAWRWEQLRQSGGLEALRRPKHFRRPRRLSGAQCEELVGQLKAGARAAAFPTDLWTLPRIAQLIEQRFAVRLTQPSVWRLLLALGWSAQ